MLMLGNHPKLMASMVAHVMATGNPKTEINGERPAYLVASWLCGYQVSYAPWQLTQ
jgi:hypothetical protein